jgi:hypothetical protein
MRDKIQKQLEIVLEGDAKNRATAAECKVDIDRIEHGLRQLLAQRIMFGSGDPLMDLVISGYVIGRLDQFCATVNDLLGAEDFKSMLAQTCIKLGINKKLN